MATLAVKYRPTTFEDVCGQENIISILNNQLKEKSFKNAYLFCGPSGCVDSETEFFDGEKWKKISEYKQGDKVLVVDKNKNAFLEYPKNFIDLPCDKLNHFTSKYGMDMCLSDEHRIIYSYCGRTNYKREWKFGKEIYCGDLLENWKKGNKPNIKIETTFLYNGRGIKLSDAEIKVSVMVFADGSFRENGNICFVNLKKKRKIQRAELLLKECNIKFNKTLKSNGYVVFSFKAPIKSEVFPKSWYECSVHQFKVICDEVMNWDGDYSKRNRFFSINKSDADFIQFAFATQGIRATIYTDTRINKVISKTLVSGIEKRYFYESQVCYNVLVSLGRKDSLVGLPISLNDVTTIRPKNSRQYCFSVSTGMWIMRRNSRISITGNCGKTTLARIFAKKLNNGGGSIIEIDAASNNSVDDVRQIIKDAQFLPIDGSYKIYILDECHLFSTGAWNAMLKLIEEPPAKTIFMFCTTDPQKIPATIIGRVQRYNFTKINENQIVKRLKFILEQEKINTYEDDALSFISKISKGGMRDSISTMEKCLSFDTNLSIDNITKALGVVGYTTMIDIFNCIINHNSNKIVEIIDNLYSNGIDLKLFLMDFIKFCLSIVKYKLSDNYEISGLPNNYRSDIDKFSFKKQELSDLIDNLIKLYNSVKYESNPVVFIQAFLIRVSL